MFNGYGSNVLKNYQVNMGRPYQVKIKPRQEVVPAENEKKEAAPEKKETADDILENARKEAERIINEARINAEAILESAHEKVAEQAREAERAAKEEGYRHGEALARQHYQNLIAEAEELRQKAKEIYDNTISGLESEIVELIIQIAKKVVGTELSQNRDVILGLIRTALSAVSSAEIITICVCADDYDYVIENKDRVLEGVKGIRDFEIKKDNSLKKGECIIDTGFGTVDSSLETQLQAVENTLRELLGGFDTEDTAITTEEKE